MTAPLDQHTSNRTGAVRAARLYSNIVSPPTIFALLGLAIALHEYPLWPGLAWAAAYGFWVSLAPIIFVFYLLQTGRIKELHMSNTNERHLPYLVAVICSAIMFGIAVWLNASPLLRCLLIFNMIELAALGVINIFWLISIHATGIMAAMLIVAFVFGWAASLIVLPFVLSVCWVRLYLKRHTPTQVIAGLGLGILSVWSLTLIDCF